MLPDAKEIPSLVPQPDSVLWRYGGDARLIAAGAYAILLQVAHPIVGAGVSEHSNFRSDPWGRLLRTLDYSYTMTYGGPERAGAMGKRIRSMHQAISGTIPETGKPYHALEPEAYAWVHATLADSIVRGHAMLGRPMAAVEVEAFYADWRRSGRLIGIDEGDLPPSWAEFGEYFEGMVAERLSRTAAVDEVLEALADPARPPLRRLPEPAWRLLRVPAADNSLLITAGLLSPRLRKLFGITWTRGRAARFRLLAGASRAATPLLPGVVRNVGPSYLRWRRDSILPGQRRARSARR